MELSSYSIKKVLIFSCISETETTKKSLYLRKRNPKKRLIPQKMERLSQIPKE